MRNKAANSRMRTHGSCFVVALALWMTFSPLNCPETTARATMYTFSINVSFPDVPGPVTGQSLPVNLENCPQQQQQQPSLLSCLVNQVLEKAPQGGDGELANLLAKYASVDEQLQQVAQEKKALQEEIWRQLADGMTAQESQLKTLKAKVASLEEQVQARDAQALADEAHYQEMLETRNKLHQAELDEWKLKYETLKDAQKVAQAKVDDALFANNILQIQLDNSNAYLAELQGNLNSAQGQLESLHKESLKVKISPSPELKALKQAIEDLKVEINCRQPDESSVQVETVKSEKEKQTASIEALHSLSKELKRNIATLCQYVKPAPKSKKKPNGSVQEVMSELREEIRFQTEKIDAMVIERA